MDNSARFALIVSVRLWTSKPPAWEVITWLPVPSCVRFILSDIGPIVDAAPKTCLPRKMCTPCHTQETHTRQGVLTHFHHRQRFTQRREGRGAHGHARIWPNRIWPKPHLAKKIRICPICFRDRIWPNRIWPELVFLSVDHIWPNRIWPILVF